MTVFHALLSMLLALQVAPSPAEIRAGRPRIEFTKDTLEEVLENIAEERAVLVDVRSLEEWKAGHIEGAIFLPMTSLHKHSLDPKKVAETLPQKKEDEEEKILYTHCVVGMRARQAGLVLTQLGDKVRVLKPGYEELLKAGFKKADPAQTSPEADR
jgi:phage shock protein E